MYITNDKKGISLITLIITIVVVIILAAVVILALGNNNPIDSARLSTVVNSKTNMEDCISIVASKKIAETEGKGQMQNIVKSIIDESASEVKFTQDGTEKTIYRIAPDEFESRLGIVVKETPNKDCIWYVDNAGKVYLVFDFMKNVPNYLKESDTTLNKSVKNFVIVLDSALESSIIENIEISKTEDTVGVGEDKNITLDLSKVEGLSYSKWVINESKEKLGVDDEAKYPNTVEGNSTEISLKSITNPGTYYLHVLVCTNDMKVEKISSAIVVEKKADVWDGTSAESLGGGSGTKDDPYLITTAKEFAYFRDITNNNGGYYSGTDAVYGSTDFKNKYIKLVADIDLNNIEFEPIVSGNNVKKFSGNFDGNNHKILNVKITKESYAAALFGKCTNATIENLTVYGNIETNSTFTGGICAKASDGKVIISNCKNYININSSSTSQNGAAGIVGYANDSSIEIIDCVNYGNINNPNYCAGGIVSRAISVKSIVNSHNKGNVSSNGYVGGIVGMTDVLNLVEKCYNSGKINGSNGVGGIVGYNNQQCSEINYCYNTGDITSAKGYVGGIIGYNNNTSVVTSCYNTGTITGNGNNISGICANGSPNSKVYNSYNKGKIIMKGDSIYYGGIRADSGYPYVYNSYYLDTSCDRVDYNNKITNKSGEPKENQYFTKSYTQEDSIAYLLNEGVTDESRIWTTDPSKNDGYPILVWQLGNNK